MNCDNLVGQFFHSFKDGKLNWQGRVLSRPETGWYLIETFSWLDGVAVSRRLCHIEQMTLWEFYSTAEWMRGAKERHV